MKIARTFTVLITTLILITIAAGVVSATTQTPSVSAELNNVRFYAAAPTADGLSYANAGGKLIAGAEDKWHTVNFPESVVAGGIAIDPQHPATVYVGAADETSLFRTTDGGDTWLRVPLSTDYQGAIVAIAVDSAQRIVYAGTDQGRLYRLHDVGSSMILGGEQTFTEPIEELAVDASGSQLAFVRTATQLYQASNNGLNWAPIRLLTVPTALAIANTTPATVYVGTTDYGVMKTTDGMLWLRANQGFETGAGTRLKVDALTVDPLQPDRVYVAASYLFGNTQVHQSPIGIAMSENSGENWGMVSDISEIAVADLLPISGKAGAVYALFTNSRTPFAVGNATPLIATDTSSDAVSWSSLLATINVWQWLLLGMIAVSVVIGGILLRGRYQRKLVENQ